MSIESVRPAGPTTCAASAARAPSIAACDSAPRYPGVARDLCRGCYGDVKSLYGGPGVVSSQASNQCAGKTLLQHCFNIVSALFQHCFRIVNIVSTLLQYFNNVSTMLCFWGITTSPKNLEIFTLYTPPGCSQLSDVGFRIFGTRSFHSRSRRQEIRTQSPSLKK